MDKTQKFLAVCTFCMLLLTVAMAVPATAQDDNTLMDDPGFCMGPECPQRCRWKENDPQYQATAIDKCEGTAYLSDSYEGGNGSAMASLGVNWDVSDYQAITCSFGFNERRGHPRAFCMARVNKRWFRCGFNPVEQNGCTIELPEWGKRVSRIRIRAARLEYWMDLVSFGGRVIWEGVPREPTD